MKTVLHEWCSGSCTGLINFNNNLIILYSDIINFYKIMNIKYAVD